MIVFVQDISFMNLWNKWFFSEIDDGGEGENGGGGTGDNGGGGTGDNGGGGTGDNGGGETGDNGGGGTGDNGGGGTGDNGGGGTGDNGGGETGGNGGSGTGDNGGEEVGKQILIIQLWAHNTHFLRTGSLYNIICIDQTWLVVKCHPEWEFRPLLFSHSWTIQGP